MPKIDVKIKEKGTGMPIHLRSEMNVAHVSRAKLKNWFGGTAYWSHDPKYNIL